MHRRVLAVIFVFCAAGFFFVEAAMFGGGSFLQSLGAVTQWEVFHAVLSSVRETGAYDANAFAILWIIAAPAASIVAAITLWTNTARRLFWFASAMLAMAAPLWTNILGKASGGAFVDEGFVLAGLGAFCALVVTFLRRRQVSPFSGLDAEATAAWRTEQAPPPQAAAALTQATPETPPQQDAPTEPEPRPARQRTGNV